MTEGASELETREGGAQVSADGLSDGLPEGSTQTAAEEMPQAPGSPSAHARSEART